MARSKRQRNLYILKDLGARFVADQLADYAAHGFGEFFQSKKQFEKLLGGSGQYGMESKKVRVTITVEVEML